MIKILKFSRTVEYYGNPIHAKGFWWLTSGQTYQTLTLGHPYNVNKISGILYEYAN